MLFELRNYFALPGKRDELVTMMEERILPYQVAKGVHVVGSFVDEEDPDSYFWIRRFDSEEQRVELYAKVYEDDEWVNEIAPGIPKLIDRDRSQITRLNPTPGSPLS